MKQRPESPSIYPKPSDSSDGSVLAAREAAKLPQVLSHPHGERGTAELDRLLHALWARYTGFLSTISLMLAFLDWGLHLSSSPGRQIELSREAARSWALLLTGRELIRPPASDRRFTDERWSVPPFNFFAQAFLLGERWWLETTEGLPGVSSHHKDLVAFRIRQDLDLFAPSNHPCLNPEVIEAARQRSGANFLDGARNLIEDAIRIMQGAPVGQASSFKVGEEVAATPGKVVFRNGLIELIQYAPTTERVRPEPILITPAWIMKYYILDLSPHNSLIRYLVSEGFTVFCISWRNPDENMRDVSFDDYRTQGVLAAIDVVHAIVEQHKIHACGYCLGGTLLSIAAAQLARDGDKRLASVTLLAAQTDFSEAGELQIFTDESQLALLDDVMWLQGYLDSTQMAGAFQMLRSNDLIWSRVIRSYLLGESDNPTDLMAWNADATRMPYRMHSEYLHRLFLRDDLAEGRFMVEGKPVVISNIEAPIFCVATETDHVAPWRSVYKIHLLNHGPIDFVLTSGGHNAGIVSEPGHQGRFYHILSRPPEETYVSPEQWLQRAEKREGSWWIAWTQWLNRNSGETVRPPLMGLPRYRPLTDAPGQYVHES